jgi:hypothetical protein
MAIHVERTRDQIHHRLESFSGRLAIGLVFLESLQLGGDERFDDAALQGLAVFSVSESLVKKIIQLALGSSAEKSSSFALKNGMN